MPTRTIQREALVEYDGTGIPTGNMWINGVKFTFAASGLKAMPASSFTTASNNQKVKRQVFLPSAAGTQWQDTGSAAITVEVIDLDGSIASISATPPSTGTDNL